AEGLCALDGEGRIVFINPVAQRMLRPEGREAIGRSLRSVVDLRDEAGRGLEQILADASPPARGARLSVGGGTAAFIVYTLARLEGERRGAVLTLLDVSERKRHEAEREDLHRRLVDTSR